MIEFMRSLFGLKEVTSKRVVVGAPVDFGLQEVGFIKDSNRRLTLLQELSSRFSDTSHEGKVKTIYEKTRNIHSYLVSRRKVHELEMFHLQNTDHFLSAFTAIMDVHQKHHQLSLGSTAPAGAMQSSMRVSQAERTKRLEKSANLPDLVKPIDNPTQHLPPGQPRMAVPRLFVPDISINTFEKITYYAVDKSDTLRPREVGYTSSKGDKKIFQEYVSERLGLKDVSYIGNAYITIPNQNGITPTGLVPVIHWSDFLYALNLNDHRLFPVRIYRNGG